MHSLQVGKQRYAFGLQWEELDLGRTPALAFRERAGKDAKGLHTVLTHQDGRKVMGAAVSPPKGTWYSAAQALAALGQDGIYVMPLNDRGERALWYVMIQDGLVVPSTDVVDAPDAVVAAVDELRHLANCPLYCAEMGSAWDDALPFDLEPLLTGLKLKPLSPIGNTGQGRTWMVLLLALAAGGAVWYTTQPPKVDDAKMRAEQAWQARTAYLTSLRGAVQTPADAGWIVDAWTQARSVFPPVVSGWYLHTIHCTTAQCLATYRAPEGDVRATVPVRARFASRDDISVQTLPNDQNTLTVRLPVAVSMQQWSDDQLLAPSAWPRPALDVSGRMGLYFASLKQDGPVSTVTVGSGRPMDAHPLNEEKIVLQQAMTLDIERLRSLVAWFGQEGFVIHQLLVTQGEGNSTGTVRLECVRYTGTIGG